MNEILVGQPHSSISTVAGNGKADYSGDGCCASTTALNRPRGVAVDAHGNVRSVAPGLQKSLLLNPSLTIPGVIVHTTWLQA